MSESASHNQRASGFTLLELLVVITILGLILIALGSGVRFAGQAWQSQERHIARQGALDPVQNVVRGLIASGTSFEGEGTSLRFVSELPEGLGRGGLYDVELHTEADALMLTWRAHFKGPSADSKSKETALIKNVTNLNFSYRVEDSTWRTTIADKTKPPVLIRVTLATQDGRSWPPLVVEPMVEVVPGVTN
jgi:general secretion pathway protein J